MYLYVASYAKVSKCWLMKTTSHTLHYIISTGLLSTNDYTIGPGNH